VKRELVKDLRSEHGLTERRACAAVSLRRSVYRYRPRPNRDWAEQHGVTLEFIKPGKPMQNGFIERFNRSYREAVLDMYVFQTLNEVREQTETWLKEYNEERPHDSLGDMTPREYLLTQNPEVSTYEWS